MARCGRLQAVTARKQLDEATVTRVVRSVAGGDAARRVRRITQGGDHHAWWIDADLVARFAPDVAATARLHREVALRDLVRPHLAIPVPVSVAAGDWARGLGFTLDRRLPGTSAEASPVPLSAMAELAGLLAGLGGIPTDAAARIGNPHQPALDLHALHRRALAAARRLLDAGELTAAQLRRVQDAQPLLSAPPQQVVLVHGDLKGEHLLIDQGRVSGVLDWTDAELGDPPPTWRAWPSPSAPDAPHWWQPQPATTATPGAGERSWPAATRSCAWSSARRARTPARCRSCAASFSAPCNPQRRMPLPRHDDRARVDHVRVLHWRLAARSEAQARISTSSAATAAPP